MTWYGYLCIILGVPFVVITLGILITRNKRVTTNTTPPAPAVIPPTTTPPVATPPATPRATPTPPPAKKEEGLGCGLIIALVILGTVYLTVDGCKTISRDWTKEAAITKASDESGIITIPAKVAGDTKWDKAFRYKLKGGGFLRHSIEALPPDENARWEWVPEDYPDQVHQEGGPGSKGAESKGSPPISGRIRIRAIGDKPIKLQIKTL